ncbi:MAG: T9SS type A sorting domain-containing protein [Flavobacteriales bacterium]|nr:T9SS type A sorting domain-containing protein [Flavobacteriales bacterium]
MHVLHDPISAINYPQERAWIHKYHLYQLLDARQELRSKHPVITAFYVSCRTANAGRLWQAHDALHPGQAGLATSHAQQELASINTALKPEIALRDVLEIMIDNAADQQYATDSILYRAQQWLQQVQGVESVQTATPSALVRTRTLNAEQYATVAELAEQCPYEYGPAVYMARALLLRNDRLPRMYRNACENNEKRDEEGGITDTVDERSYKLYPNPNTGEFTLLLNLTDNDLSTMQVWSISGQQVLDTRLQNGNNTINLNVAEGLYLYRVTVNGTTQWTGKVSITSP